MLARPGGPLSRFGNDGRRQMAAGQATQAEAPRRTRAVRRGQHGQRVLQQRVAAGAVLHAGGRKGGYRTHIAEQGCRGSSWPPFSNEAPPRLEVSAGHPPTTLRLHTPASQPIVIPSALTLSPKRNRLSENMGSPPTSSWLPPLPRSSRRTELLSLSARVGGVGFVVVEGARGAGLAGLQCLAPNAGRGGPCPLPKRWCTCSGWRLAITAGPAPQPAQAVPAHRPRPPATNSASPAGASASPLGCAHAVVRALVPFWFRS